MSITRSLPATFRNSSVRPGPVGLVVEGIREALSRRRLIWYLVRADLKKTGSDTLLGNVWWVLDPLLQMVVYVVFVSIIVSRSQPDYPLFIFSAILPWKWFTDGLTESISSVVVQQQLIKQVQFPKIALPLAATLAAVVDFAFGMIPLAALLLLLYRDRISWTLVLIPLIAVVQLAFSLALDLVLSAVNVFVRDVGNIARHVLRLWWYLSPGLYGLDQLDKVAILKAHPFIGEVFRANPFAILFGSYRAVIYGSVDGGPQLPDWTSLGMLLAVSAVLVLLAIAFFKRLEPQFAKVL